MKIYIKEGLSIFLLSLFVLPLVAQINLSQPLPIDPNVKIGKLANGITYYIRKNAKPEKKVELRLVVNAGSVLEDKDQQGLAHFMEHMNFNGSQHFPKNELVNYLQKVGVKFGADLNAYTSFDETVYILPMPTEDPKVVEQGFTVLEDWAGLNLFDKSEIDKERGVVLEESRLSKGADERMSRLYFPRLFNGSIYAERLPIGKDSILKNFNPETLKRFYKTWYRPNLMAVVAVGDMDVNEMEKKIKAHFSHFKNPPNSKARPSIIPITTRTQPEAMVLTDDEATNTILQIYNFVKRSKPIKTWGDYRENITEGLITSLINQRLNEITQNENPPFIYGFTGFNPFLRGYQAFISFAVLGNNPPQEAVDALVAETEKARQFGFLKEELERAKANLLNQTEKAFIEKNKSESANIVWQYINNFLQGSPIPGIENRYAFIKQILPTITLQEVNGIAKKMPATSNAFALITAPASRKDQLPDNNTLLQSVVAATKKTVTAYEEKAVAKQLLDSEPVKGNITNETTDAKPGTTDLVLSNGVTVTLKPTDFKNDEIQMDAWRWGGFHKFDIADKENAQYAANLVDEMGVKDMSATDLRKFLSGKTVSVTPYINEDEEGIEGRSGVKDLETFLQLTYLYFTQPRKDESAFRSFVTKQKASIQFLKKDPQLFYQDTLSKIVYNNNPWVSAIPTEKDFDRLNLDKTYDIYKSIFSNAYGMHFTFVGNLDLNIVKPLLEKYLGSLPAAKRENMYKDNGIRPVKGVVETNIKKGKEAQSFITIMFSGETNYTTEENLNLKALLEALNIKVIEKLREDMSGIYGGGLYGSIQKRPYLHYTVTADIPCGPENVNKLTSSLFDLLKTAREKGIDQTDLDKVKETWRKQYHVNLKNNDYWLNSLSTAWINSEDPGYILNYEKMVDAITVKTLQQTAQKFLTPDNYIKIVLYPENFVIKEEPKPLKPF
ncbi:MAG: insulinase family protein [Bacteroidota bacterium]|nr:insulinase family protein [Bacteroidota bacterium]